MATEASWKDSIFRQREELARMLREPIALLGNKCAFACDGSHYMRHDELLAKGSTFWTGTPR